MAFADLGFTLIELLVVIVIIGTLATLTMIGLDNARGKARDAKRVTDVRAISSALDLYFSNEGNYPPSVTAGLQLAGPSGTVYMSKVPNNPHPDTDGGCAAGSEYTYAQTGSGTGYLLSYCLGNGTGSTAAGSSCALPGNLNALPASLGLFPGNTGATPQLECSPCICGDCSALNCNGLADYASSTASCTVGGITYYAVKEGTQCWLDKNINIGVMQNGTLDMTDDTTINKWCYSNNEANCTASGGLYWWSEVMYLPSACNSTSTLGCAPSAYLTGSGINAKRQGLCPKGWHVPSDYEFWVLEHFLDPTLATDNTGSGGDYYADQIGSGGTTGWRGTVSGDLLKPVGTCSGRTPCGTSNLNFPRAGYRGSGGSWFSNGSEGHYFISSINAGVNPTAWKREIYTGDADTYRSSAWKSGNAQSLRCVRD
ncbi:MAG: FISUMP domain-containing protein [Candidatus Falkowbacteria bacterium]